MQAIAAIVDHSGDTTEVRLSDDEVVLCVGDSVLTHFGIPEDRAKAYGVYTRDQAITLRDALTEAIKALA